MKPTEFEVDFFDVEKAAAFTKREGSLEHAEPEEVHSSRDLETLDAVKAFVAGLGEVYWGVYRRTNITDGTPEGDGRGAIWDFETVFVGDCSSPKLELKGES